MFPFNDDDERYRILSGSLQVHVSQFVGILMLLVEKGIATPDEIEQAMARGISVSDQVLPEIKAKKEQEWREANPDKAKVLDFIRKFSREAEENG